MSVTRKISLVRKGDHGYEHVDDIDLPVTNPETKVVAKGTCIYVMDTASAKTFVETPYYAVGMSPTFKVPTG